MLAVSTIPRRIPLSKREIAEFSRSFRRSAREQGFSPRRTDRYEAWVLAFVSWCWEHESGRVRPDRLGSFQRALKACPETDDSRAGEAMDALAFLLGSAKDAHAVLAATGVYDADGVLPGSTATSEGSPTTLQTLHVGWRGPKSTEDEARGNSSPPETQTDHAAGPAHRSAVSHETASSTAELCIQRYQNQIESLHRGVPHESASEGKLESGIGSSE